MSRDTLHERRATGEQPAESLEIALPYWVVIPAYDEAATVRDVAIRARQQCPNVIVVDDGSTDGTAQALFGLDVTVLRNEENRGKAGSLLRGFNHALSRGAIGVVTLDADGQHIPEEIPLFVNVSLRDPSVFLVGARRRDQRKASIWRYIANRIADFWIGWAAGQWVEDSQSGFRLYPVGLLRSVSIGHGRERSFVFESEILIEAARRGIPCRHVLIKTSLRVGPRPSHFRPVLDIVRITRMVGWRLLRNGMCPMGLYRVIRGRNEPAVMEQHNRAQEIGRLIRK